MPPDKDAINAQIFEHLMTCTNSQHLQEQIILLREADKELFRTLKQIQAAATVAAWTVAGSAVAILVAIVLKKLNLLG